MFCNFLDCTHVVCLYQKSVRVCNTELVCKAVRLAFSCQTSAISLPFILNPWLGTTYFLINQCLNQIFLFHQYIEFPIRHKWLFSDFFKFFKCCLFNKNFWKSTENDWTMRHCKNQQHIKITYFQWYEFISISDTVP